MIWLPRFAAAESPPDPVDAGVRYLIERIGADEEGWAVPPKRNKKVIRREKVIRRYRMVEVEVPVYEKVEKEILVRREGDSSGAQGTMERKTIMVDGKQIGTRTVKRRKRDPEGPIEREETRNIHGPGGPDLWRLGDVGHNGLVAYTLLKQDRPEARDFGYNLADRLDEWVETFGVPDLTWDLVWLIAAFAESGDEALQARVPGMVRKLVDAQIREGPAEGLWGPVSIDPERLRYLIRAFLDESESYAEVEAEHGDSDRPKRIQLVVEAQNKLEKAREALNDYTLYYRTARPHDPSVRLTDDYGEESVFRKPSEYLFHTRSADLESTWLALTGLRIAKDHGLVASPDANPPAPGRGNAPPPHRDPRDAVLQSGRALQRVQHPSGAFPEANLHQPVRVFDDMPGIPGVPLKEAAAFPELASPITLRATARGLSSYVLIGHILGEQAWRPLARDMVAAKKVLDAQIDEVARGDFDHVGLGGLGWLGFLWPLTDTGPHMEPAPKDLLAEARSMARARFDAKDGNWEVGRGHWIFFPGVWREQSRVLPKRNKIKHDFREPFVWYPMPEEGPDRLYSNIKAGHAGMEREVSTAVALRILAGGTE